MMLRRVGRAPPDVKPGLRPLCRESAGPLAVDRYTGRAVPATADRHREASWATLRSIAGCRSQSQESSITSGLLHFVHAAASSLSAR